jgi:hypothetical protein
MAVYIDGTLKSTSSTNSISTVASGGHTIVARAYDAGGQMGSASVTVYRPS